MSVSSRNPKSTQHNKVAKPSVSASKPIGLAGPMGSVFHLQRVIGNQGVQRMLQPPDERSAGAPASDSIPIYPRIATVPPARHSPGKTDSHGFSKSLLSMKTIYDAASPEHLSRNDAGDSYIQTSALQPGLSHTVQRFPGDGMTPPGDCSWGSYAILRGSVETAKAVVSTLGSCAAGDSCLFLATKIAAISAEIAARVALDTTCFKGGDTGHRQQVQDKVNMLNRCYRFFSNSNCDPELITAMEVVVAQARATIAAAAAAAAVVVVAALVAALVVAIIALAEVIAAALAAAAAAAAEAAAITAAVAAVIALLAVIKDELPSGEPSEA